MNKGWKIIGWFILALFILLLFIDDKIVVPPTCIDMLKIAGGLAGPCR